MASLLVAATLLSYTAIKTHSQKRRARRAHRTASFSALEQENAARIAHLQSTTCFCQRSDWRGGGCDVHGYVPPAGEGGELPLYTEIVGGVRAEGMGRGRGGMVPEFQDGHAPYAAAVSVPVSGMQGRDNAYGYRGGGEEGGLADWGVEKAEVRRGERSGTKVVGLRSLRRRLRGLDGMR